MQRNENKLFAKDYSLTAQLKRKDRRTREGVKRLAAAGAAPRLMRNDVLPNLERIELPLSELRSPKRKVRKSDPGHVMEVAASISEFGFSCPVLIGKNNNVLDGQIRVDAAKLLGLPHVPCVRLTHLSEVAERAFSLAARRLGEKGQWDLAELKVELEELILEDAPIEVTGFMPEEFDQIMMGEETSSAERGPVAPKPGAAPVARVGDVYGLGQHRVICGDSTDPAVLDRVTEGCKIACNNDPLRGCFASNNDPL
jgi:ParB-like nuclease domain